MDNGWWNVILVSFTESDRFSPLKWSEQHERKITILCIVAAITDVQLVSAYVLLGQITASLAIV